MYVCATGCKEQVGVSNCGSNACKGFYHNARPCCRWAVVGLEGICAVGSNLVFVSLAPGKRDSLLQVWCFGKSSNVFSVYLMALRAIAAEMSKGLFSKVPQLFGPRLSRNRNPGLQVMRCTPISISI